MEWGGRQGVQGQPPLLVHSLAVADCGSDPGSGSHSTLLLATPTCLFLGILWPSELNWTKPSFQCQARHERESSFPLHNFIPLREGIPSPCILFLVGEGGEQGGGWVIFPVQDCFKKGHA